MGLQVSVDRGCIQRLPIGILSRKKLLVVFDLNGILCHIVFPGKLPPASNYLSIEAGSFKRYVLPRVDLRKFWCSVAMVAHVMIWTCMRRESAELIVSKILWGCPQPHLILGQEHCSRLESTRTKKILQGRDHDVFFKDLPRTVFQGEHSEVWEDFKPNATNTILVDDTPEKGALCDNGNVVILPSWPKILQPDLCDGLLSWLMELSSSTTSVLDFVRNRRYGLSPVPLLQFSEEQKQYDRVIGGVRKSS